MIETYDTTLRDGTQAEGVTCLMEDKLKITKLLDDFGIDVIEGGWPGSNPKDEAYFKNVQKVSLKHAKIAAFGSTYRAKLSPTTDLIFEKLKEAETPIITIFGKSWDLHVKNTLKIDPELNLELIYNSIAYLSKYTDRIIYDAEHFFDGYVANKNYAEQTIMAAQSAGADTIVLCETNGGRLPFEVSEIVGEVKKKMGNIHIGIHTHNDSECAVANTLAAVNAGAEHVQGTVNGYGERCGNANLCSIIPNLELKMNKAVGIVNLKKLTSMSRRVDEILNLRHKHFLAYVGKSAFAHKGGIHVSAVLRDTRSYEHIEPTIVGNRRRVLVSDLSGVSNIIYKANELGIDLEKDTPAAREVLFEIKKKENMGYNFESADASFILMVKEALNKVPKYFKLISYRVLDEKREKDKFPLVEATVRVEVNGVYAHTASMGNGPVSAFDAALRTALERFYPTLKECRLSDYKDRILNPEKGTDALTRLLITTKDSLNSWETVGVSTDILDASKDAICDSIIYKLLKDNIKVSDGSYTSI